MLDGVTYRDNMTEEEKKVLTKLLETMSQNIALMDIRLKDIEGSIIIQRKEIEKIKFKLKQ